jgi:hypothetical protein
MYENTILQIVQNLVNRWSTLKTRWMSPDIGAGSTTWLAQSSLNIEVERVKELVHLSNTSGCYNTEIT